MNLRESLKKHSKDLHDLIENQYPYNTLSKSENIEKNSLLCLLCFKLTFYKFLETKKSEHEFYQNVFDSLSGIHTHLNDRLLDESFSSDPVYLEYIFLGSRLGTNVLLKMNPCLSEIEHSEYFTSQMPSELWQEFCEKTSKVIDQDLIEQITIQVRSSFQTMIKVGMGLESSTQ